MHAEVLGWRTRDQQYTRNQGARQEDSSSFLEVCILHVASFLDPVWLESESILKFLSKI